MAISLNLMVLILKMVTLQSHTIGTRDNWKGFQRTQPDDLDASVTDQIVTINQELIQSGRKRLFESDIELTDHDHVDMSLSGDIDGPIKTLVKRNAQRARQGLWITRLVPYEIDSTGMTEKELTILKKAIATFNNYSCLQWKAKTKDSNWVKIAKKNGCSSSVGRKYWAKGSQELSLGPGCYRIGTIHHEMLHASGFWHEQSRPDRNNFVKVMWENIQEGMSYNFNKYSHQSIDTLNKAYDYESVMHYGMYGFSKNGKPTLLPIDSSNRIGQRNGLSPVDVLELNALYDCTTPSGGWSSWTKYSRCDQNCYKFRQRFCTAEDRVKVCPEANIYGVQTSYVKCTHKECNVPIDGHWGRWSSWGPCSTTCDQGTKSRTRVCDDPPPKNGGSQCAGSNTGKEKCLGRSCSLGPDDCQFEVDFCFWTQSKSDTSPQPWFLNAGSTSSGGTGPTGDHTSGSGKYIYAEASSPAEPGKTASIISKTFNSTRPRCMVFWYNMYGENAMGSLNVYIQTNKKTDKVWTLSGNQGMKWKNASIDIKPRENYKVIFEAVRGSSFRSDIALDDVMFKDGKCARQIPSLTRLTTTQRPTQPPADFCNFGAQPNIYCTWYNDPTNDKTPDMFNQFNWKTHSGPTPSFNTGPPSGHSGAGYYAYIEASSPFQPGMKARLVSKQYQPSLSGRCFDFWYYMYGAGVGTLKVGLQNTAGYETVWSLRGNKGQNWLNTKVSLKSSSPYKIVVEGVRGSSFYGDIAIDDLKVTQGPCA